MQKFSRRTPRQRTYFSNPLTVTVWMAVVSLIIFLLYAGEKKLIQAHENHDIAYFAGDAPVYYEFYSLFSDTALSDNLWMLLNGFPVVQILVSGGSIFYTSLFNLAVALFAVITWAGSFSTKKAQATSILAVLIFPYLSLGFFSLNKEVFVMSSILLFVRYWMQGEYKYLVLSIICAWMGRYHMAIVIVFIYTIFPREKPARIHLAVIILFFISFAAPLLKPMIPGYSSEGLIDDSMGVVMGLFINAVDNYLYFLIYPFKYIALVAFRFYGAFVAANAEAANSLLMESYISIISFVAIAYAAWLYFKKKKTLCQTTKTLFLMAFLSPIPIMWSDIGHWRYYSYIYFLIVAGLIVQRKEKQTLKTALCLPRERR